MGDGRGPIQILFVEDSAGDALLTGQILTEFPVRVKLTIARDGLQALMLLADRSYKPDLIILDLNLPIVSGQVVLERNERKEIPVVVFSASWNAMEVDRAFELGVRECIQKPMDLRAYKEAVLEMVEKWCLRKGDAANGAITS
jgi:CheY-like chemotaxis protein